MRHTHEREILTRPDGLPIDFTPNNHRTYKVSRDYWDRMLNHRPVGIAPGTEATSDGTPTVLCHYADGTSEVRTVSSFRTNKERQQRSKVQQARQLTEAEKYLPSQADILGQYS